MLSASIDRGVTDEILIARQLARRGRGLVIRGNTNKQVAGALGCTERTIKAHRHRVMEKTQVRSLPELVSLAERVGVLRSASGSGKTA